MKDNLNFSGSISISLKHLIENNDYSNWAVLVDENTEKNCLHLVSDQFSKNIIRISSGEASKSISACEKIWQSMTDMKLDRKSLLINLGGGVICDLGGFCASTYKRGIRFAHIPTTLLAMTDAAIGGKTGINFNNYKNHIGTFSEAEMVIINPIFLETLNQRQLRSGYAEVLKHAIISDNNLWDKALFKEKSKEDWEKLIEISSQIKGAIVKEDFREQGLRKKLNFGHSIGHLIESYHFDKTAKLHGEAIAEGMMIESFLAYQMYLLSEKDLATICNRISDIFDPEPVNQDCQKFIIENISQDKKNTDNRKLFVLPKKMGEVNIDQDVKMDDINMAISNYNDYLS